MCVRGGWQQPPLLAAVACLASHYIGYEEVNKKTNKVDTQWCDFQIWGSEEISDLASLEEAPDKQKKFIPG